MRAHRYNSRDFECMFSVHTQTDYNFVQILL